MAKRIKEPIRCERCSLNLTVQMADNIFFAEATHVSVSASGIAKNKVNSRVLCSSCAEKLYNLLVEQLKDFVSPLRSNAEVI
jgi:hypothetical protein